MKAKKNWVLVIFSALLVVPIVQAELTELEEFISIEDAPVEEVRETVVVREIPTKKRKRRRYVTRSTPEVVYSAPVDSIPREKTLGEKLQDRIDLRFAAERRKREERILKSIEKALSQEQSEPSYVNTPVSTPAPKVIIKEQVVRGDNYHHTVGSHDDDDEEEFKRRGLMTNVRSTSIRANLGLPGFTGSRYSVDGKSALGVNIDYDLNKYISLFFGYTYAQYEFSLSDRGFNYYNNNGYRRHNYHTNFYDDIEPLEFNQNIFSVGLKYGLLSKASTVQPYVASGMSYLSGFLNYTQRTLDHYAQGANYKDYALDDYSLNSWAGFAQGGFDLYFSRNAGLGINATYYLTFNSSDNWDGSALVEDRDIIGRSLRNENFYVISGYAFFVF